MLVAIIQGATVWQGLTFWEQFGMMLLATALSSTVPLTIFLLTGRHNAKKEQTERHEENTNLLRKIRDAIPHFHSHHERGNKVGLTTDGIVPRS